MVQSAESEVYPTFVVDQDSETKASFKKLHEKLAPLGVVPSLRIESGTRMIRIIPLPAKKKRGYLTNLLLFIVTVGTVITAGYLSSTGQIILFLDPSLNVPLAIVLYTVAILFIFGLHELGHKVAAWRHGIKASYPYFIPGLPPYGTFGALILQDSPPINRDALFDLGVSGPLVGLLVTIPVIILGLSLSTPVSPTLYNATLAKFGQDALQNFPVPLLFDLLQTLTLHIPANNTLFIHPLAFAGWLGLLVTFLNTLPVAQLDGGHVFRAALNEKWHRYASYVGLGVLVLSGFLFFAILVGLLFMRSKHPGPLDDVSSLSRSRMLVLALFPVIWVLAFPMMSIFG